MFSRLLLNYEQFRMILAFCPEKRPLQQTIGRMICRVLVDLRAANTSLRALGRCFAPATRERPLPRVASLLRRATQWKTERSGTRIRAGAPAAVLLAR